jgi:hypothetical protein
MVGAAGIRFLSLARLQSVAQDWAEGAGSHAPQLAGYFIHHEDAHDSFKACPSQYRGQHPLLHDECAAIDLREKVAKFLNFTFGLDMLFGYTF